MFNLLDFLVGKKVTSPIPDPTIPEMASSALQGLSKNYIYNPETKKIFPNSMMNNSPDFRGGRVSEDDLAKILPIIMSASLTGTKPGRVIPVNGMQKGYIRMAAPKNVVNVADIVKKLGFK